jgi:hypothetical protein
MFPDSLCINRLGAEKIRKVEPAGKALPYSPQSPNIPFLILMIFMHSQNELGLQGKF